jgi:hypothetical protein
MSGGLDRSSSTEIDNILDVSNIIEVEAEDEADMSEVGVPSLEENL